ncbi:MAG: hypothetical protein HWE30_18820 [Methylocystaceae bacterium]|nr:hypothetical protein [Methylocystaceae bacterium]
MANALIAIITAAFIGLVIYGGVVDSRERRACLDQGLIPARISGAGIRCIAISGISIVNEERE